jgi:hypothetical protein
MCNLKLVHRAMFGNEDKCPDAVRMEMVKRLSNKRLLVEIEDKHEDIMHKKKTFVTDGTKEGGNTQSEAESEESEVDQRP